MKSCRKCRNEMNNDVNFCPNCGEKTETPAGAEAVAPTVPQAKKKRNWLKILAWIFLLPIMLIIAIWKSNRFKKSVKVILTGLVIIITLAISLSNANAEAEAAKNLYNEANVAVTNKDYLGAEQKINSLTKTYPSSEYDALAKTLLDNIKPELDKAKADQAATAKEAEAKAKAAAAESEAKKAKQKYNDILMEATKLKQAEVEQVFADLNSVGIKTISKCTPGIGTGVDELQAFRVETEGEIVLLTIEKRNTFYIGIGSVDLYKNGAMVNQIGDFTLSALDWAEATVLAERYVQAALKAPSTAKFPGTVLEADQWSIGRYKDIFQVSSYVDSQNSFGAMIRSKFVVEMSYNTKNLTFLSIDGKTIYGSPFKKR